MKTALLAAVCLALGGCASFDPQYEWVHSGREPLPMTLHEVSQEEVQGLCCNTDIYVRACAWRDYEKKFCGVFFSSVPSAYDLQHEKRHCDGWEHQVVNPIPGKVCLTPEKVLTKEK